MILNALTSVNKLTVTVKSFWNFIFTLKKKPGKKKRIIQTTHRGVTLQPSTMIIIFPHAPVLLCVIFPEGNCKKHSLHISGVK